MTKGLFSMPGVFWKQSKNDWNNKDLKNKVENSLKNLSEQVSSTLETEKEIASAGNSATSSTKPHPSQQYLN